VKIVAAGVHHPRHPGAPGRRHLLLQGQGVHIRAPGRGFPGPGSRQIRHHAVVGDARPHLQPQIPEIPGHHPGGALLLVGQLRVLMQLPAQADDFFR